MIARSAFGRATSVKPASTNIDTVPWKRSAAGDLLVLRRVDRVALDDAPAVRTREVDRCFGQRATDSASAVGTWHDEA